MSIIIYTRNDCVQCHATKRAMESRGVDFEMVNIDLVPGLPILCVPGDFASCQWWWPGNQLVWLSPGHD